MNSQVRVVIMVKHELSCPKKRRIQHREKLEKEGVEKLNTMSRGEIQTDLGGCLP